MDTPYTTRLAQIRQRLDAKNPQSGLKDRLKTLKRQNTNYVSQNAPPSPIPWSAQAETAMGTANRDRDFANTDLSLREQRARQDYGFDDMSNPYSRAAQLQRSYQNAQRGTTNSYAAAGQLYAGSLNNARNIDSYNFNKAWSEEQMAYQRELADIATARAQAEREAQEAIIAANAGALEDALSQAPDPSASPAQQKNKNKKKGKKN